MSAQPPDSPPPPLFNSPSEPAVERKLCTSRRRQEIKAREEKEETRGEGSALIWGTVQGDRTDV